MTKLKERFSKYKLAEWIVFILGAVALCIQLVRYATNTLEGNLVDVGVFTAATLFLFAPKTLISIIKSKSDAR